MNMFLDKDIETAVNGTRAKHEVMVWFAAFGDSAQPIGFNNGIVTTRELNGTIFNLYSGLKGKTYVFTWVVEKITERFVGDLWPLISDLFSLDGSSYPKEDDYLGSLSFGTEAFSSDGNITFWANRYEIDVRHGHRIAPK
ncbi:hypothetical protein N7450_001347, partial [Penicillium hetheringtonii]